jgi:hypothetical protein
MTRAAAGAAIVWLWFGLAASCTAYDIKEGSGGAGAAGSSGSGGVVGCTGDSDCQATADPCKVPRCGADGVCTTEAITSEHNQKPNAVGDCKAHVCKDGVLVAVADPTDLPDDANDCTLDECVGDAPKVTVYPAGSACPGGRCKADFMTAFCVECLEGNDCSILSNVCQGNTCSPGTCENGIKDLNETSADCGGSDCGPCVAGSACKSGSDCISGNCKADTGKCVPPTCTDGIHNGSEAGIDCAGDCDALCNSGDTCRKDANCESGICHLGKCQAPQCDDNKQNGTETGIDCGGDCLPCPTP